MLREFVEQLDSDGEVRRLWKEFADHALPFEEDDLLELVFILACVSRPQRKVCDGKTLAAEGVAFSVYRAAQPS